MAPTSGPPRLTRPAPPTLKGLTMSKTNSPSNAKRALRLTAQRKLELYLATRPADAGLWLPGAVLGDTAYKIGDSIIRAMKYPEYRRHRAPATAN